MTWTCPHCGCNTTSITVHLDKCTVMHRDRYVAALDRGDGCIVSQPEWVHIARSCHLLSRQGLRLAIGCIKWRDIAAHFGLRCNTQTLPAAHPKREPMTPEALRAARAALDAPLTDAERHACTRRGATEFSGTQGLHTHWQVADVW